MDAISFIDISKRLRARNVLAIVAGKKKTQVSAWIKKKSEIEFQFNNWMNKERKDKNVR